MGTLPVAGKINRRPAPHGQSDDAIRLLAVADAAQVLTPSRLLGITDEIWPGDVVVMPEFTAAQPGEVGFGAIGAGAVDAVTVLVVDPLHGEAGMQRVPGRAFVGVNRSALGDAQTDCRRRRPPRPEIPVPG